MDVGKKSFLHAGHSGPVGFHCTWDSSSARFQRSGSVSLQRGISSKILAQLYKMVPAILGALPSSYHLYFIPG